MGRGLGPVQRRALNWLLAAADVQFDDGSSMEWVALRELALERERYVQSPLDGWPKGVVLDRDSYRTVARAVQQLERRGLVETCLEWRTERRKSGPGKRPHTSKMVRLIPAAYEAWQYSQLFAGMGAWAKKRMLKAFRILDREA